MIALGGFALAPAVRIGYRESRLLLRRYSRLELDESSEHGTLSAKELEVVRAVFEVISPKPAPSVESLLEFVNLRTSKVKGCYHEYRDAIALLQTQAGKRFGQNFAALEEKAREDILREILPQRLSSAEVSGSKTLVRETGDALQLLFSTAERRFQEFFFMDLFRFYWLSSDGWAAVGYSSHPGVPSPPHAYTAPPISKTIGTL